MRRVPSQRTFRPGYARYAHVGASQGSRTSFVGRLSPDPDAYDLTFRSSRFRGEGDVEATMRAIRYMMHALVGMNVDYLLAHPETPTVYASGVRYKPEEADEELWADIPAVLRQGVADCEDLAAWRIADLIVREGVMAKPHVSVGYLPDGRPLYHVRVEHPDGRIEDPSVALGMR